MRSPHDPDSMARNSDHFVRTSQILARGDLVGFAKRVGNRLHRFYDQFLRTTRKSIATSVYSVPWLSQFNPCNRLLRFKDHCVKVTEFPRDSRLASQDWYLRVRPPQTLRRRQSISLNDAEARRFQHGAALYQHGNEFEIPELFLASINNARLYPRDFLVLSRDNHILFESALSSNEMLEASGIFDHLLWPRLRHVSGTYCLLTTAWAGFYYHWLIDALPRLAVIEQFPELQSIPLVVHQRLNAYHRDSLRMAGVSLERIIPFDGRYWQVDRLFFTDLLSPTGNPSPLAVKWLRTRFLTNTVNKTPSGKRRLYLTRRDASQRRVLNEQQLTDFLQETGFEIVCPGDLSFSDQIQLFSEADIVVAPHGAGATNMVFAPSTATLIELFGDNYINGCYWALANICGYKHAFLTGPATWLDYTISLNDLKALLSKVCGIS